MARSRDEQHKVGGHICMMQVIVLLRVHEASLVLNSTSSRSEMRSVRAGGPRSGRLGTSSLGVLSAHQYS